MDCPGTLLPGRCAFHSVQDALAICSSMTTCRAVVSYHQGEMWCGHSGEGGVGVGQGQGGRVSTCVGAWARRAGGAEKRDDTIVRA